MSQMVRNEIHFSDRLPAHLETIPFRIRRVFLGLGESSGGGGLQMKNSHSRIRKEDFSLFANDRFPNATDGIISGSLIKTLA